MNQQDATEIAESIERATPYLCHIKYDSYSKGYYVVVCDGESTYIFSQAEADTYLTKS